MGYTWNGDPAQSMAAEEARTAARKTERVTKSLFGVFDPSKCGTRQNYYQHGVYDVPRCQPCKDAESEYARGWRKTRTRKPTKQPFDPSKCGENRGYQQHINHGTNPCGPCTEAHSAYMIAYNEQRRAA